MHHTTTGTSSGLQALPNAFIQPRRKRLSTPNRSQDPMKTLDGESLSKIFTKSPQKMADLLSSKEFAQDGLGGGLRLLSVYIAYTGRRLSASRRQSLERARELLLRRTRQAFGR
jgi:hypothetical protein